MAAQRITPPLPGGFIGAFLFLSPLYLGVSLADKGMSFFSFLKSKLQ